MDILKIIGVIIGAVLLGVGLWRSIGVLTALGFIILAGSMVAVANTRSSRPAGESEPSYH